MEPHRAIDRFSQTPAGGALQSPFGAPQGLRGLISTGWHPWLSAIAASRLEDRHGAPASLKFLAVLGPRSWLGLRLDPTHIVERDLDDVVAEGAGHDDIREP